MKALLSGKITPYVRAKNDLIVLNTDLKKDLEWWQTFLPKWNGTASFLDVRWCRSDVLQLFTDASGTHSYGAYFQGY